MSKPTTQDERKFIENKAEKGWKSKDIAKALGISIKTVRKWRQRLKKGVRLNLEWDALAQVPWRLTHEA